MKTKPTHTKGPWTVELSLKGSSGGDGLFRIRDTSKEGIAICGDESVAHLIAAAPELLEALTNCVAWIEMALKHSKPDHANLVQAKAAISKAKGGAV
jgi:hypothetical protein